MKALTAASLRALVIGACIQTALAVPLQRARAAANTTPKYQYDPNTSKYCVWWIDSDGAWTCQDLRSIYGVAVEDFLLWARFLSLPWPLPANSDRRTRP
jgi:hypothetical protein